MKFQPQAYSDDGMFGQKSDYQEQDKLDGF